MKALLVLQPLLLAVEEIKEIKGGYGSVIFVCVFIIALIFVGIWWLNR